MGNNSSNQKNELVLLTVVTCFLALLPTFWVAYISNSVVLLADLCRCTGEFLAVFASWAVVRATNKKDSAVYNFGLGKLEYIASLLVAAALFLSFIVTLFSALIRFQFPVELEGTSAGLVLSVLSILGNSYIWYRSIKVMQSEYSSVIDAQARLFRAKTLASAVVLIALLTPIISPNKFFKIYSDPIGSLIISSFLLYSAYEIVSSSLLGLLDRSLAEARQLQIMKILLEEEGSYDGFKQVRTRRSGTKVFIEVFLGFAPNRTISSVQAVIVKITNKIHEHIPEAEVLVVSSSTES